MRAAKKEIMLDKLSSYGGREIGHLKKKNKKKREYGFNCKIFGYLEKNIFALAYY